MPYCAPKRAPNRAPESNDMAVYENRYLYQRGKAWNYKRRVPGKYKHVDSRSKVRASLDTKSLDIARIRRDAMERADEAYWAALANDAAANKGVSEATQKVQAYHYEAAKTKALTYGFICPSSYKMAQVLGQAKRDFAHLFGWY